MWRASSSAIRCWSGPGEDERRGPRRGRSHAPDAAAPNAMAADWAEAGRDGIDTAARERPATDLEDVPPADADAAASRSNGEAPTRLFGMGGHRRRRARRRRLQSRGLRLGRDDARRSSRRAARARGRRSRAAHDRAVPDRSRRRGRLSQRRSRRWSARSSALRAPRSKPCWRSCRASILPACARAISPNASPSSSRSATASIPRCRRWSLISICLPSAISRPCAESARVDEEDLADMIGEIRQLNPKPGLAFGSTLVQPIVPDVFVRPGPDGGFHDRAQFRHPAQGAGQPELPRGGRQDREERQGQDLSRRLPADRDLADPRARSARQDHPEGGDRDRAPAGRFLRPRRPAPAPAQSQDHRGRHRHARIDRLAGHRQQVHGDQPRHLRAEIFLHFGDRGGGRRRSAFGRSRAPPHPAADRR